MKKNDWYMAAAVILIAVIWWGTQHFVLSEEGSAVTVTRDGEWLGTYSLLKDDTVTFTEENGGKNILVIRDGKAHMDDADCPDRLCVKQKPVSKKGESIICLPHRLAVEVMGGGEAPVDAAAR